MKSARVCVLALVFFVAGGCTTVERNPDDVPQTQTGLTPASLVSAIEVTAPTHERNSDELTRVLLRAQERTVPFDLLTAPLRSRGIADDAAVDGVCTAFGHVLLGGPHLTRHDLFGIIVSDLKASLHGDHVAAMLAGQHIINELSDGTATDQLWARVALSRSGHCRHDSS